ncbi:MarR family transcriptional regulator [Roseibium sp.]|uniref:MarR family winged helix-turn-helix transcriptional regulator n=1 Tax=Roseibium sp. TaxID=1936156 RepID=UPI003267741C
MNDKTNQMSLLDAIGLSEPEKPGKPEKSGKGAPETVETIAKKPRRKAARSAGSAPASDADNPVIAAKPPSPAALEDIPGSVPPPAASADRSLANGEEIAHDHLPLDRFLCFALYSANHAMHSVYKTLLKEIGLTYPQYLAMTVLWENNNVPVGTITSKLQLDTNTLTPLLKRLETMGLVTRTRNPKDERQVILKLTRKGRALQKKTTHFSACVLSGTGLEMDDVLDLQSKVMTLRDNLRKAGLES